MFDSTVANGSIVAIILMVYAYGVMFNIGRVYVRDPSGVMTPGVVRSTFGTLAIIATIPTIIWPAIYAGLFDGLWAGVVIFLITTVGGAIATTILGVTAFGGLLMGIHFYLATFALVAGYWLSLTNLPS